MWRCDRFPVCATRYGKKVHRFDFMPPTWWGWGGGCQRGLKGKTNTILDMDAGTSTGYTPSRTHECTHIRVINRTIVKKKWPHLLTCICFLSFFSTDTNAPFLVWYHYTFITSFNQPQCPQLCTFQSIFMSNTFWDSNTIIPSQSRHSSRNALSSASKPIHAITSVISLWFQPSPSPRQPSITE